jgi:hypothetical protein
MRAVIGLWIIFLALPAAPLASAEVPARKPAAKAQLKKIEPILDRFCFDCHGGGSKRGGVAFDPVEPGTLLADRDLWWKTLKMLRAGLMPPKGKPRPSAEQIETLAEWIKRSAFGIDPKDPDPGRVTVRRLNRIEYRNTIRDLMGVSFDTGTAFPADDTGHGFDNIGDVLTLSPLLLEKYIAAARSIVAQAVPAVPWVVAEKRLAGVRFRGAGDRPARDRDGALPLSYYKPATVSHTFEALHPGRYQLLVDTSANERFVDGVFDYNKCRLLFKVDGKVLLDQEYSRQGGRAYHYEVDQTWKAGKHELTFELQPLTPKEKQVRSLTLRIVAVTVRGPLAKEHWVRPANYQRFFPEAGVPEDRAQRRRVAHTLLKRFASRAYRRPVDEATVERLVSLAERTYTQPGRTFEAGISQAMTVVLASPRFLFREEGVVAGKTGTHPLVDEHALATRLSYFLWSSLPDEQLVRLADENRLRKELGKQVERMLADPRSAEFVRNFVGQWLEARRIESVPINAFAVLARDNSVDPKVQKERARFRELIRRDFNSLTEAEKKELAAARAKFRAGRRRGQFELTRDLRQAMRRETEMLFEHLLRNDRSLLEIIDCDYTFLNERLARHYGIDGVSGEAMRLVKLPKDSVRGGVLTQGSVLAVTSNPDRTSPVKRGLFILDNILGTPPPPAPPDIPPLEEAAASLKKPATLREALKAHRDQPLCSSCHNRMDPLGLALENFNALGRWRDRERGQPIDASGQLLTGESFSNLRELKRILVNQRRLDFYRCLTEKMLTYALGRGLEYHDVQAVDEIVARLEKSHGKPSVLLQGVIDSVPFQKRRAARRRSTPPDQE